jgi:DNA-binding MarR family transcriptional regulator
MDSLPRGPRSAPLLEEDVFVGLQRTADWLLQGIEQLLKTQGLSQAQYNVLRILRGAGPRGLSCREICERMITRDPDMTRLLDRMEERGLVARERQQIDRRVVTTRVTPAGLKLLKSLDHPVREYHRRCFRHIAGARLKTLAVLLEEARKREPG